MKTFNQLNMTQRTKALKFIRIELRNFIDRDDLSHCIKQNTKQFMEYVRSIAVESNYDDEGNVLIGEIREYLS